MADQSAEILKPLVARFAVLEQLTINMLVAMSDEYETPDAFRQAFLEDVRSRLSATLNKSAGTTADKEFAELALTFCDQLTLRIGQVAGALSKH